MCCEHRCTFVNVTADTLVAEGPVWITSIIVNASVSGGDVTIYNGRDATSGRKFAKLQALANVTTDVTFPLPLYFEDGLFVDVGSNINEVIITFHTQVGC